MIGILASLAASVMAASGHGGWGFDGKWSGTDGACVVAFTVTQSETALGIGARSYRCGKSTYMMPPLSFRVEDQAVLMPDRRAIGLANAGIIKFSTRNDRDPGTPWQSFAIYAARADAVTLTESVAMGGESFSFTGPIRPAP